MTLDDLLVQGAERMPMGYARALLPRVDGLLSVDTPRSIRRQLNAVRAALENESAGWCVGLDRLHYCLDEWERRYCRPQWELSCELLQIPMRNIGLPHDGETFDDETAGDCADTLEWLRAMGYNVPQYALDALREEAFDQRNGTHG